MKFRTSCFLLFLVLLPQLFPNYLLSQVQPQSRIAKPTVDDDTRFTTAGSIGMTITNFGTIGDGFAVQSPVDQPSCEYPRGSGIEHMFVGGLWIGGRRDDGTILVTTGARDIPSLRDVAAGFEFSNSADPNDVVRERSSIIENFLEGVPANHMTLISTGPFRSLDTERSSFFLRFKIS